MPRHGTAQHEYSTTALTPPCRCRQTVTCDKTLPWHQPKVQSADAGTHQHQRQHTTMALNSHA
jgi:hypothetical protein